MFIVVLFMMTTSYIQLKWTLPGEQLANLWYVLTVEYYSMVKRNNQVIYATTWMSITDMLHKESLSQKITDCAIPFMWHDFKYKTIMRENRSVVAMSYEWK